MILVNFKIYKETFGDNAVKLAKICKEVMEETKVEIIPVVSALDAYRISSELKMKVYLQSVDEYFEGAKTGNISPIQAKELGIGGSLLNHSEHKIKSGTIKKILKNWPSDFDSVICIQTLGQTEKWAKNIKPTMIAYEPSYLIGSKDKSVSTEKPEVVKKMVEKFKDIPVLAGAGIKTKEDIKIALKLGAKGILISSAIIKSNDPKKDLLELTEVFGV